MKPKVGDLVRLKPMRVVCLKPDYFTVHGQDHFGYGEIEEILPRPLKVGDRVSHPNFSCGLEIVALRGEYAWVESPDRVLLTHLARNLTRIDDAP